MLQVVSILTVSERNQVLDVPRQHFFSDSETMMKNSDDLIKKLGFPLIAKPLMADGSETSHKMYLVFDKEGLDKLESRMIIMQEFVNHGGVLFKVYVVGDFVKRKSLPDIKEDKLVTMKGLLPFSQMSNLEEKTDCGGGGEFDRVEMPPVDFVEEVAKAMKEETGISLLNFDLIRDARDAKRFCCLVTKHKPLFLGQKSRIGVVARHLEFPLARKGQESRQLKLLPSIENQFI
ncbi:inositol-tetrakisphosphate 1-kinase 1-like isoform X1 [Populus alba x Populus x berolinensis]|nr:inositol-tetrakisphosphate 1-kinase 1-like isoform X1 [Populus alba x Populus x berolinensis]